MKNKDLINNSDVTQPTKFEKKILISRFLFRTLDFISSFFREKLYIPPKNGVLALFIVVG